QTVLKKIGFDVDGIQNPRIFQDSLLRMNPDVLVMNANGKRVKGLELAKTVKKNRDLPRIILVEQANVAPTSDPEIAAWLNSPVSAMDLLNVLADTCGLDRDSLSEKYNKLHLTEEENE